METDLDAIAAGDRQKDQWLQAFYFGDDALPGLKRLVEENLDEIDAAAINTFPIGVDPDGDEVVVKPGRYGPYVKRGDDTASVPEDMAPDELTIDGRSPCSPRRSPTSRSASSTGSRCSPRAAATARTSSGARPTSHRRATTSRRCRACSRR